jgi:hypothetical protein
MNKTLIGALLAGVLGLGMSAGAAAQTTPAATAQHQQRELARGEPSRWMKEDRTVQAQLATKKKEIGAALNEALAECKRTQASERSACVKQARETYRNDLANARELVTASNQMGGVHETTGPSE